MKSIPKIASAVILTCFGAVAYAEDPMADQGMMKPGMKMHKGMMMGGRMSEEQKDRHLRAMQNHMLMMHEMSNKIIAEKDPAKKQALKDQQLEMMKAHRAQMMEDIQKMRGQKGN